MTDSVSGGHAGLQLLYRFNVPVDDTLIVSEALAEGVLSRDLAESVKFTPADLDALLQLERYCFSPWLAFGRKVWRNQLRHGRRRVWLLWQQDQVIAYLALLPHNVIADDF